VFIATCGKLKKGVVGGLYVHLYGFAVKLDCGKVCGGKVDAPFFSHMSRKL
jgi:hypothetical protein